jgi:GAF domain-containing protein
VSDLYQLAKTLVHASSPEQAARAVLESMLSMFGADRGFVVIRAGDSFEERFDVRFARATRTTVERRFSRSLVREAMRIGEAVISENVALDPRFQTADSAQQFEGRAAMAVPFAAAGAIFAVVYLDRGHPWPPVVDDRAQEL